MAKLKTFKKARADVLDTLAKLGWTLSDRSLKTPHATSPGGRVRLWFRPQAVWFTTAGAQRHDFGEARSLHLDIREYHDPVVFVMECEKRAVAWGTHREEENRKVWR